MNKIILTMFSFVVLLILVGSVSAVTYLNYSRFDIYIMEDGFYTNYQADLDTYFDNVEERLIYMENLTGWSSEDTWGQKMRVEVSNNSAGCYGGMFRYSGDPVVQLVLSDPFPNIWCRNSYREDSTWKMGYPGPLGDYWGYVGTALHEMTHGINPQPLLYRKWLTEGWAEYHETNILVQYGDLNQESADYFIYIGSNYFNWLSYTGNDYRDTSPGNNHIQQSPGYSITAWMWTMLRDNNSLSWPSYYRYLMDNIEILQYTDDAWGPENYSNYQSDMFIIDLFGKHLGLDMNPIFRYDGPAGPGWGVRYWTPTSWYPDLSVSLGFSNPDPMAGETIDLIANITNSGESGLNNFKVRFYNGTNMINEQVVSVGGNSMVQVTAPYTDNQGTYNIIVRVDEDDIKFEANEANNEDAKVLTYGVYVDTQPNVSATANVTSGFEVLAVSFDGSVVGGNSPLTYAWDFENDGTIDAITEDAVHNYNAGSYTANFTVTDKEGDSDTFLINVNVAVDNVPTAGFTPNATNGLEPLTVYFTNTASGGDAPLTYSWDLDGDGVEDSTNLNEQLTYLAGTYTVNLTVTDNDGDTDWATQTITVQADTSPVASVNTNTTSGNYPLAVYFDGVVAAGNGPFTYAWDFENDGTIDATTEDAVHTYNAAGSYTVNFTVTDNDGDSDTVLTSISVTIPPSNIDLEISELRVQKLNPAGQFSGVRFKVTNTGTAAASNVGWMVDTGSADPNVYDAYAFNLNSGEDIVVYAKVFYANPGTYSLTATVDDTNSINEVSEGNNQLIIPMVIS